MRSKPKLPARGAGKSPSAPARWIGALFFRLRNNFVSTEILPSSAKRANSASRTFAPRGTMLRISSADKYLKVPMNFIKAPNSKLQHPEKHQALKLQNRSMSRRASGLDVG